MLIENQLERADHGHLGQIMTYLAGLEAHTVVWVATGFRDAHLSALKWLNEHTVDPFAFFAVKVKAVRIGDSPIAPVFEVVERPNEWERQLHALSQESRALSDIGEARKAFWAFYLDRFPDERRWGPAGGASNRWRRLDDLGLVISQYISKAHIGLFLRPPSGGPPEETRALLLQHADALAERLGAEMGGENQPWFFGKDLPADRTDRSTWPALADWLHTTSDSYEAVLRELLEGET